ncbi:snoRNA-binding rRNA-processing protein UTP6 [Sporobolomyces salmoneus]|uniref:snoRNA-binding rRNA-processing protein UTP6 n=1 Tax=Sporobolomyces salmoneus TaxID=183962 RepID=UPI003181D83E
MSEKVQLALERFLPELRDLEQRKVFTKAEINDIVAKRRGFEISLANGRSTKPLDYLRYIDYETKLEKLRRARVIRLQLTSTKSRSDYSIQYHITQLHRLSVRRFPESLELWDAYIAHALSQDSPQLVSKTLSAAISMHPMTTRYWIMASRWESEGDEKGMGGGNTEGARRLCMRALRFLKKGKSKGVTTSKDEQREGEEDLVWKEWLRVEVAFVEKLKSRQQVLGLGKGKDGDEVIVRVNGKRSSEETGEEEGADEEEEEAVKVPLLEGEEDQDQVQQEVDQKALSGQEAILDGAIVRAVLDNFLKSNDHSLFSYRFLLSILRPLPSTLRLHLLAHVYASLSSTRLQDPTHPSYSAFFHLYATRPLYDVPYSPPKSSKKRKADEAEVLEPENPNEIKVQGEKLVDAVGKITTDYWKVLKKSGKKGSKGKGKGKEIDEPLQKVWETFAGWLEEMDEFVEDEDLSEFLVANLTRAFTVAPPSPFLALIRLRLLSSTSAPSEETLAFAQEMSRSFGGNRAHPTTREQIWVARIETGLSLSTTPSDVSPLVTQALKLTPFSAKLWNISAEFTEQSLSSSPSEISQWYLTSIQRTLLTDALPPPDFVTSFTEFVDVLPRELLPRRFVHYLSTNNPAALETTLLKLLESAPTLSLSFLTYVLTLRSSTTTRGYRHKVHEKIVNHPEAGAEDWVEFAKELMEEGEVKTLQAILRKAEAQLGLKKGQQELERFQGLWQQACRGVEE